MLLDAESAPLPPEVTEDLRVLHRHAQRVARIAQGLLSFARQSSGQRGPVDLNHLVEETLLLIERQVAKAGMAIQRGRAPDLPPRRGGGGGWCGTRAPESRPSCCPRSSTRSSPPSPTARGWGCPSPTASCATTRAPWTSSRARGRGRTLSWPSRP